MLRAYSLLVGIKVDEISGSDLDSADTKSLAAIIQEIKIDELFERIAQCCRIIITGRAVSAGQMEPRIGHTRLKKTRLPKKHGQERTCLIAPIAKNIALGCIGPDLAPGNCRPE